MLLTGDDFRTQRGMYLSPQLWRSKYKDRMRHVFGEFKNRRSDVVISYHSCGSIRPIIDDLVEIGLEVLNPVQPRAKDMVPADLKQVYGGRLAFFGGVDQQLVIGRPRRPDGEEDDPGRDRSGHASGRLPMRACLGREGQAAYEGRTGASEKLLQGFLRQ